MYYTKQYVQYLLFFMKFIEDFDFGERTFTGGQTGSVCIRGVDGHRYQYKPSILKNSRILRRAKAGFTDRENFGEVIASFIARSLLSDDLVPEVSLVYDPLGKSVGVASKYLGEGTTLDSFAFDKLNIPRSPGRSHVVLNYGSVKTTELSQLDLDKSDLPRSDICDSLALAAMLGDHDVNPGNLVVLNKTEGYRVARIDLGHAFRDLLNAPQSFGGALRVLNHPVLDFFNRPTVAGGKLGGDSSKFKRDYRGFVPSIEMVKSLRKMSQVNRERVTSGVINARQEFDALIQAMTVNHDEEGIKHVKKSLCAIYKSLKNSTLSSDFELDLVLQLTFNAILQSTLEHMNDAEKVANVMELQLEIEASVAEGRTISERGMELIHADFFPKDALGQILWVSVGNEPGFRGNCQDYVKYIANKNKENVSPQRSLLSRSFRDYKKEVARLISHESNELLSEIDLGKLRDHLVGYLEKVEGEKEATVRLSGFSKEDKKRAVNALLDALDGKAERRHTLSAYLPVFNDGRLGKLIKEAIQPNSIHQFIKAAEAGELTPVQSLSRPQA